MKCATYTRTVPWKNGIDTAGYTIEKQTAAVTAYIRKRGWKAVRSFSDGSGHEGLFAMLAAGLAREFDAVVFPSIYFAAGDYVLVTQKLQETLYPAGVQIAVADEDFFSGEKSKEEVADYFEAKRRERHGDITKSWKASRGDGFVLSNSVPFGYIRRDGEARMKVDEELRPVVAEMFRRKMEGMRSGLIAGWLNQNGVDTPSMRRLKRHGKDTNKAVAAWTTEMVTGVLSNPVYTGARTDARKRVVKEHCYEAYISKEQFEALFPGKYRLAEEKAARKSAAKHLTVFCARCGKRMSYKNGIYRCTCPNTVAESLIKESANRAIDKEKALAREAETDVKAGLADAARRAELERISIKMRAFLKEATPQLSGRVPLYDAFKAGTIAEDEYNRRLERIRESYNALEGEMETCMNERAEAERTYSVKNGWIALFASAPKGTETPDRFVERIEAGADGALTVALKEGKQKHMLRQALGKERD